MKVLFLSSASGLVHEGKTAGWAGTNLVLNNLKKALRQRGAHVTVLAAKGSALDDCDLIEFSGNLQKIIEHSDIGDIYPVNSDNIFASMIDYAYAHQKKYDFVINFGHDYLPIYCAKFFTIPFLNYLNLSSTGLVLDRLITATLASHPHQLIFQSQSQCEAILSAAGVSKENLPIATIIHPGMDFSPSDFSTEPQKDLAWAGRISPEKGLLFAARAAKTAGLKLKIAGYIQDEKYFHAVKKECGEHIAYAGFLASAQLNEFFMQSSALLQTQECDEAFGMVTLEAQAAGTPVIAFRRGANGEIVQDGKTGYLTQPGSMEDMLRAISGINNISRGACRKMCEARFSLENYADQFLAASKSF